MDMNELVDVIYEDTVVNGGTTVGPFDRDVPTTGYMVATPGYSLVVPRLLTKGTIHKWLVEDVMPFIRPEQFIGAWYDAETGNYWLDVSVHIADLNEALNYAQVNGQLAIWDIANGQDIYLA